MKNKIKMFAKSVECKVAVVASAVTGAMMIAANAMDTEVSTALSTGFTSMQSDAMSVIAIIVPIALGIAGTIFVLRKGLGWFKSLAK